MLRSPQEAAPEARGQALAARKTRAVEADRTAVEAVELVEKAKLVKKARPEEERVVAPEKVVTGRVAAGVRVAAVVEEPRPTRVPRSRPRQRSSRCSSIFRCVGRLELSRCSEHWTRRSVTNCQPKPRTRYAVGFGTVWRSSPFRAVDGSDVNPHSRGTIDGL